MDNNQQQDIQIPPEIRSYIEGILADANMATLDADMKEEMVKEIFARLDNYITATIVDNLSQEDVETFIKMNEEGKSKAEIESFVKEKMPNYNQVFQEAFMNFRDLYLGNVSVSRNAPESTTPEQTPAVSDDAKN